MKLRWFLALVLLAATRNTPEPFAPFAIPTGSYLQDPAFSPDGKSVFLTKIDANGDHTIVISILRSGVWSTPTIAPFSGHWRDLSTVFSADGNEIIFASNRPLRDGGAPIDAFYGGKLREQRGGNLWSVTRQGDGWGRPVRLPDAVNSSTTVFSPALAADGTLYFMHPGGAKGRFQLFIARRENGSYRSTRPAPFSDAEYSDFDPTVAPDNSFVIFSSNRPPSRSGTADLFITFHRADGWTTPQDMDHSIDPNGDAIEARLSPDAKTLYYTSNNPPNALLRVDISPWIARSEPSLPNPKMFAKGAISDGNVISSPVFSPDGATLYFSSSIKNRATILESHFIDAAWSKPSIVAFSGQYDDMDPTLAPDGSYIVFSSKRPVSGNSRVVANLWRADRKASGWGTPVRLPTTVNVGNYIFAPNVASDGSIYFLGSNERHVHQLLRSRYIGGVYRQAQPLPFSNAATNDYDPAAGPDQSYVVFASSGRARSADKKLRLYIAIKNCDGWNVLPLSFAGDIGNDSSPIVDRQGASLYFTSDRDGSSNVWTIPFTYSHPRRNSGEHRCGVPSARPSQERRGNPSGGVL